MRAKEFIRQQPVDEAFPALASIVGGILRGGAALGGAALRGLSTAGKAVAPAIKSAGSTALTTAATTAGAAVGKSVANKITGSTPQDQKTIKDVLKPGTNIPSITKSGTQAKVVQVDKPDEIGIQDPSIGNATVRLKVNDLMNSPELKAALAQQPQS